MKNIIKTVISIFSITIIPLALLSPSFATIDCNSDSIPPEVKASAGCSGNTDNVTPTVINIINAIIGILGLVAVVIIIYGGVQYMTSAGDAGKVKKAKDTILYAVIGLIVCVLAYAIVNFVIGKILGNNSQTQNNNSAQAYHSSILL